MCEWLVKLCDSSLTHANLSASETSIAHVTKCYANVLFTYHCTPVCENICDSCSQHQASVAFLHVGITDLTVLTHHRGQHWFADNNHFTAIMQSVCNSQNLQLRNGGFVGAVLLPICLCWWQLVRIQIREKKDARVFFSNVTTTSPYCCRQHDGIK